MATTKTSLRLAGVCQRVTSRTTQKQIQQCPASLRSISNGRIPSICRPTLNHFNRTQTAFALQLRYKSEDTTLDFSKVDDPAAIKSYNFSDITKFVDSPSPKRILIDVREPSELQESGHIPGAKNMPINSSPDGLFLPAHDFEDKFGWDKPQSTDEVIFYCKAGVRSHAASKLAQAAGWKQVSEYPGSWLDWVKNGGKIEH